jgi:UDP-N-acetylmuramoyl-tripeptide--D-alanyl-D-alanine ligase
MLTLAQAARWLPGSRLVGAGEIRIERVHTDSRSLRAGDLFVALRGDRFDGHDFLPQAAAAGAVAVLAERGVAAAGVPGLEVSDSRLALGQLAASWRSVLRGPLIAVTGSNGKTTVTQMLAAILRAYLGEHGLATQGNFNNDIGVPLTLLRLRPEHRMAVVELGMNHPGEIAQLARMASPTVALVNNAQREHLEFMATVEAVARENGSVMGSLPADGVAVFPADDDYTPIWRQLAGVRKTLTFSLSGPADVRIEGLQPQGAGWQVRAATPQGPLEFALQQAGRHNVKNALAAAACAMAAGIPLAAIAQGLSAFEPVQGRSRSMRLSLAGASPRSIYLVDDSYNANPDSVRAAIEVLKDLPGPHLLVLGDMGEVGEQGAQFHAEVGAYAKAQGIEQLWCTGPLMRHAAQAFSGARHFEQVEDLVAALEPVPVSSASVLVKGSRFMRMERAVQAIAAQAQTQQAVKEPAC